MFIQVDWKQLDTFHAFSHRLIDAVAVFSMQSQCDQQEGGTLEEAAGFMDTLLQHKDYMIGATLQFKRMLWNYEWECDLDTWGHVRRDGVEYVRTECSNCGESCLIEIKKSIIFIHGDFRIKHYPSYTICECGRLLTCRRKLLASRVGFECIYRIGSYINSDELEHDEPDYDDMED